MSKKPVYQEYYEDEATKNLEMGIYAYGPPHGPRFKVEGIRIYSDNPEHDYRTVERYKEYKECCNWWNVFMESKIMYTENAA